MIAGRKYLFSFLNSQTHTHLQRKTIKLHSMKINKQNEDELFT